MEKCLYTSGFNIEGESGEEETPGGFEDEEGKWGNRAHIDRQQVCETIHTSRILDGVAPSAHNLKCLYTNANIVINKMDELRERILVNDFDVIAVTETWAKEEIIDSELSVDGYVLYRKDRKSDRQCRGGGVIILVKTSLKSKSLTKLNDIKFQDSVWCQIELNQSKLIMTNSQNS